MSTENIYEIIKASNQVSNLVEDTNEVGEGSNSNTILWVLGGMLVLGVVLYYDNDIKDKNLS